MAGGVDAACTEPSSVHVIGLASVFSTEPSTMPSNTKQKSRRLRVVIGVPRKSRKDENGGERIADKFAHQALVTRVRATARSNHRAHRAAGRNRTRKSALVCR